MKDKFIKGLELNQGYYNDVVKPILRTYYPKLRYSAGLIGYGSDVLGYDTYISMDHNWGPRLIIFLQEDEFDEHKEKIDSIMKKKLPYQYMDFSTNFSDPETDGTQAMKLINTGEVNHFIEITTISEFLNTSIGIKNIDNLEIKDWLKLPEQGLLEITEGKVFHDGLGVLSETRDLLKFYPNDVLKLKLAGLWNSISTEEAFIGRNVDIGQELGAVLIASRIVNSLMKICFYLEGKYFPYSKWFSYAFERLKCAKDLQPIFKRIVNFSNQKEMEEQLCLAYQKIVELQNRLGLTEKIEVEIKNYYGRPYKVVFTSNIVQRLMESIDNQAFAKLNIDKISFIQSIDGMDITDNKDILDRVMLLV